MDQPPPDPISAKAAAETAAARAVAAEESARQHAWRESARSSTTVMPKPARRNRLLVSILAVSSVLLALACAILLLQMQRLEVPGPTTPRRTAISTRVPPPATQAPAIPATVAPVVPPVVPDAPTPLPTSAPPPSPLVITIPAAESTTAPAQPPPPTITLSAEERRQLQNYERRLVSGTDLLSRDLTEREQTIARLQRRLTFEPGRQPPLGAIEELAEAVHQWEGAVGDERERLTATVHNRRAEVANLQRQLIHDQEVAESLRKRLEAARQELDDVRKKMGPPP